MLFRKIKIMITTSLNSRRLVNASNEILSRMTGGCPPSTLDPLESPIPLQLRRHILRNQFLHMYFGLVSSSKITWNNDFCVCIASKYKMKRAESNAFVHGSKMKCYTSCHSWMLRHERFAWNVNVWSCFVHVLTTLRQVRKFEDMFLYKKIDGSFWWKFDGSYNLVVALDRRVIFDVSFDWIKDFNEAGVKTLKLVVRK